MTFIKCTIHDVEFGYPDKTPAGCYHHCPWCMQEEMKQLQEAKLKAEAHRDALVKAIKIVRTVEILGTRESGDEVSRE